MDISERNFEATIEQALLAGGPDGADAGGTVAEQPMSYGEFPAGQYRKRDYRAYDRARCLLADDVFAFLLATQPKEWW